ncbi:MAG: 1 2-dihydroxy-3-keto-5-methylthiopentene dioxygenase [Gammaproteobacteria bacterium]|nr:MAG: 1 2-dihydroxy-3-keto-5-methylthiopentene dioxygenase [Gammaproteobacteria bacterium]TND02210.1 MAG: 1,2-dihydroxy-3-keto-5-methylthiopentene dioxygenase [Gammaproteobacteria bacterium]
MSMLRIYQDSDASELGSFSDFASVSKRLEKIGVLFEQWSASQPLKDSDSSDTILSAYKTPVDRLMAKYGFQSADVVSLQPDHPDRETFRKKFLDEHTHTDFEVRFFVRGQGLFYIHAGDKVYCVLCEKGDLISVPADTRHWFDMGTRPQFTCIRLFTTPEGWVASYTGDKIAQRFPTFDELMREAA